jgi:hypothetical protein
MTLMGCSIVIGLLALIACGAIYSARQLRKVYEAARNESK